MRTFLLCIQIWGQNDLLSTFILKMAFFFTNTQIYRMYSLCLYLMKSWSDIMFRKFFSERFRIPWDVLGKTFLLTRHSRYEIVVHGSNIFSSKRSFRDNIKTLSEESFRPRCILVAILWNTLALTSGSTERFQIQWNGTISLTRNDSIFRTTYSERYSCRQEVLGM